MPGTVCVAGGTGLTLSAAGSMSVDASQTQITAVGTVAGTWQGTVVADAYVADDLTGPGGTINDTVIGGSTIYAAAFTSVTVNGATLDI